MRLQACLLCIVLGILFMSGTTPDSAASGLHLWVGSILMAAGLFTTVLEILRLIRTIRR
jgi:hypothetical protein